MNHHQVNSEHHHFQRILNSSKGEILKAMKQNPKFHGAVSDAMHVAEQGGNIKWHHEVGGSVPVESSGGSGTNIGGGLLHNNSKLHDAADSTLNFLHKTHDPITEAEAAEESYDGIHFGAKSARGWAKNAMYAVSGNAHAASAHMKTGNLLVPGMAAYMEAPAQGFSLLGHGLGKLAGII